MIKKAYVKYDRVQSVIDPKTGLTQQSFKDECDINTLLQHWMKTGVMPNFRQDPPSYGDFADLPTMQEAANLVLHAEQVFADLPDDVREQFASPMDYFDAVLAAEERLGTMDPLDVIVPTDTKDTQSGQKGGKDGLSQENVQESKS